MTSSAEFHSSPDAIHEVDEALDLGKITAKEASYLREVFQQAGELLAEEAESSGEPDTHELCPLLEHFSDPIPSTPIPQHHKELT